MAKRALTWTGRARLTAHPDRLQPGEIEPGRRVVDNWDLYLVEPWAERKARRAREREAARG